jgi:N-methylhydantoinase A
MAQRNGPVRIASDIGGTFTDVVLEAGSVRHSTKVLTTAAPEEGVLEGIARVLAKADIGPDAVDVLIHGTTLATNALIERKGARTAFLTTEGFRDILEMGYEKRFDHYDLMIDKPAALVPRALRLPVRERLAADGSVLVPLDEAAVRRIGETLIAERVEAVAVGFLHAYAHDRHERRVGEILADMLPASVTICLSCEVAPEIREYERFSTTVANAYVRPLMAGYLGRLGAALAERGFRAPLYLMMSGGGLTTLENARRFPVRLVESGPAGGAILATHLAAECGIDDVLAFDMGGTTAKICLITDREPERARRFEVARAYRDMKGSGLPVRIPVIELVEIGAGGGSIARVDSIGRITVGPDSAGSMPGPVCYGRGGSEPTVTDANLALGKIEPAHFAGGTMSLDVPASRSAIARAIGAPLGLDGFWPAAGIAEIVEENMANAARVHAIERGRDIAATTMIAFGGSAPLHACRLAEKLGIARVLVPRNAGVGSAVGFLRAPIAYEVTRSASMPLVPFDAARANALLADMEAEARAIVQPALEGARPEVMRIADLRYVGQGHEIRVPLPAGVLGFEHGAALRQAFEALYQQIYGLRLPAMAVEAVTWSVTVAGRVDLPQQPPEPPAAPAPEPRQHREVYDAAVGGLTSVPLYWRFDMADGTLIEGPAIIAEHETSSLVGARFRSRILAGGHILMERKEMPA